jgi:signal transduction histidine kinase
MMTILLKNVNVTGRLLSFAMLVTLHLALWTGLDSLWIRPLLFAHLGLFLLWQPLWRGGSKLSRNRSLFIVAASVFAMFWLNWWLLAFWVSSLFALVGGRVFAFQGVWQRLRYLLVMVYLLAALLFWVTPQLFALSIEGEASQNLMGLVLPLLLLVMVWVPHQDEALKKAVAVDLIYSLLLFMLLVLLVLGSLAFMNLGQVDYYAALLRTLFVIALMLFALGWLWNPRLGFSGFSAMFSRYFLNIGTPFELWLKQLTVLSQQEINPEIFLKTAAGQLAELPWLVGLSWSSPEGSGQQGECSVHKYEVVDQDFHLQFYTRHYVAPSILLHMQLQCQTLAYFYQSKLREQRLREVARLQVVYETGARLTHDLKNMLQSLLALISIAQHQSAEATSVLQKQLPIIAERIQSTLDKLKLPRIEFDMEQMPLELWWRNLQQRQQWRHIEWQADEVLGQQKIPSALFDSIVENLIENARNKRLREPDIKVRVTLDVQPFCLSVCDSGSEIPAHIKKQLLMTVVGSEDGLGVGLFQAARWAEQYGYRLQLNNNIEDGVCFELVEASNVLNKIAK